MLETRTRAEEIHADRRHQRDDAAVAEAEPEREERQRRVAAGDEPEQVARAERRLEHGDAGDPAEAIGEAADREAADDAADADQADEADGARVADAEVARGRRDVSEGNEHRRRGEDARGVHPPEAAAAQRLLQRHSRRRGSRRRACRRAAQHQRRADAGDEHAGGERLQRVAPAERVDRRGRDERKHERADADPGAGDAGRERAPANEPRRHAGDRGRVDEADAEAEAAAPGDVDRRHRLREAARQQAGGDDDHSRRAHQARPEAIGEHAGAGAEEEVDQPGESEDERDVGTVGGELGGERAEERGERIGDAEDDRHASERAPNHPTRRADPRATPTLAKAPLSRHELCAGQLFLGLHQRRDEFFRRGRARSPGRATGAPLRRRRSGSPALRRGGCSSGRPSSRCRART